MRISIIAAISDNGTIGRDNRLPWRLPADLRRFKELTMGKPLIMGRKTWESIGRPLPGRKNIVLSRDPDCRAPGCTVVHSAAAALQEAGASEEVMVIGGASLYELFLPQAHTLLLTYVHGMIEGEVKFPQIEPGAWSETSRDSFPRDGQNQYPFTFVRMERIERLEKDEVQE